MINRIVKLRFCDEYSNHFEKIFKETKPFILNQKGCLSVVLMKNIDHKNEFFTYSTWDSQDDLNNYRKTTLFKTVWKSLKPNFVSKAEAWSLEIQ